MKTPAHKLAVMKAYADAHREERREYQRDYYTKNKTRLQASMAEWRAAQSPDEKAERHRKTYAKFSHKYVQGARERETHMKRATPAWADKKAIGEFYKRSQELTAQTGVQHSVDHVLPLKGMRVSGLHVH